jgi:hypothetical protein
MWTSHLRREEEEEVSRREEKEGGTRGNFWGVGQILHSGK